MAEFFIFFPMLSSFSMPFIPTSFPCLLYLYSFPYTSPCQQLPVWIGGPGTLSFRTLAKDPYHTETLNVPLSKAGRSILSTASAQVPDIPNGGFCRGDLLSMLHWRILPSLYDSCSMFDFEILLRKAILAGHRRVPFFSHILPPFQVH